MKLAATIELYAYWNRLRGARSAPERNDVDPGAIRGVLADTFVLDFDARRGFPFRIAGSRANALFLKELQGPFVSWSCGAAPIAKNSIRFFIASPTRRRHSSSAPRPRPPGLDAVDVEIILLPLRHHGLTHSRVLGGLAVHAAPHGWV